MVLSAIMKLDAGGFTTPLGKVTQGIQTTIRLAQDLGGKLLGAFDLGGEISDLAAQTGELPSTLSILQQAFADTGVGAESTGQILAIMRKNLAGISDDGSTTNKTFERLGLSTEALKNMSANDQLKTIGDSIRNLATPADRSAAAMEIFGRSGTKMLTFFNDGAALDTAASSLGGLPGLLDRNANAFDGVSDAVGRIKKKSMGLWAGIAEGALPAATAITESLDGIDLTSIGQKIGEVIGTVVEMFRTAPLGQLLKDGLMIGLGEAVNGIASLFVWLSRELWKALSTPLSYLSAAFGKVIQEMMELIGKIPKVGKMLGLDGFKADTFSNMQGQAKDDLAELFDFDARVTLIDVSEEKKRIAELWKGAGDDYKLRLGTIQTGANAAAGSGGGIGQLAVEPKEIKTESSGSGIPTDALARIGIMTGGGGQMASIATRQLSIAEKAAGYLEAIKGNTRVKGVTAWA